MFKTTALMLLAAGALSTQAQLMIDRSGGRDVLFDGEIDATDRVRMKLDSKDKSLSATFLGYALPELFPAGNFILGAKLKASATDGWEELFRFDRLPGLDASVFGNWTSRTTNGIWFASARAGYRHEDYALFDPSRAVSDQFSKPSFDGVNGALSFGGLKNVAKYLEMGFAISAGFERDSNYKDLSKVDVTDISQIFPLPGGGQREVSGSTKTVRSGTLERFNTFPLNLVVTFDIGLERSLYDWVPGVPDEDLYGIVLAPYGEFVPREEGKPTHAVGLQFTLRRSKDHDRDLENLAKNAKSTYPISVFVERRNAFGDEAETKAGAALVYNF